MSNIGWLDLPFSPFAFGNILLFCRLRPTLFALRGSGPVAAPIEGGRGCRSGGVGFALAGNRFRPPKVKNQSRNASYSLKFRVLFREYRRDRSKS
jgi:hypothetical protein